MLAQATAVLPAEDIQRAKLFYTEKLGLSVLFEMTEGILFKCEDGSTIFLYPHERTLATHTAASFVVKDLLTEVKELRSRGVVFEDYDEPQIKTEDGVKQQNDGKAAWFVDSEGNIIGVVQM